jgi:hypothetical protein
MRNVEDDPFDRRVVIDLRIGVLVREERADLAQRARGLLEMMERKGKSDEECRG